MNQVAHAETTQPSYQVLYKLGSAAALLAAALTFSEVIVLALYPPPSTIEGWFALFQGHKIIGLLDFWGLEIPLYAMLVLVFLALYIALRKTNPGLVVIAITFALLGIGIFLATNNPFSMLALSNHYSAATTEAQRAALLAAGQALLANTSQRAVGGFNMGLFLVSIAGLIVSWVMSQSSAFNPWTAYIGIVANALSLADYLRQALTSSAVIALLIILPNALFLIIWYSLIGRELLQVKHLGGKMIPIRS